MKKQWTGYIMVKDDTVVFSTFSGTRVECLVLHPEWTAAGFEPRRVTITLAEGKKGK